MSGCVFCKIVAGEIPCKKIYEDDEVFCFYDINPAAPLHFLAVPKKHVENVMETDAGDAALLGRLLFKVQEAAKELGASENGGRIVINVKRDGGQTVDHLHVHFLGGRSLSWPPG